MAPLAVYADATTLIGLARINRLDLLRLFPVPIRVTQRVWQEAAGDAQKPGVAALQRAHQHGLLIVVDAGDPAAYPQLDAGEATVVSAAAKAPGAVLVDERKTRTLLTQTGKLGRAIQRVTGVVGHLLLAKRRGHLAAVRPLLDALIAQQFRLGAPFYDSILRQSGES